jgi:hypothetical protein
VIHQKEVKQRARRAKGQKSTSRRNAKINPIHKALPASQISVGLNIDDKPKQRDDWMTESFSLPTYAREKEEKKPVKDLANEPYDLATSSRELNPYFRTGEGGLPSASER